MSIIYIMFSTQPHPLKNALAERKLLLLARAQSNSHICVILVICHQANINACEQNQQPKQTKKGSFSHPMNCLISFPSPASIQGIICCSSGHVRGPY